MKTRALRILIEKAGEKTCASKPGVFCKWLGTKNFGQEWTCMLFNKDFAPTMEWLPRFQECLDAEEKK